MAIIKLYSDFRDYYDHRFCGSWEIPTAVLNRLSRTGLSRRQQFRLLHQAGFTLPLCGSVQAVAQQALQTRSDTFSRKVLDTMPPVALVVYLDEFAHCGEGKELLLYYQAIADYPDHFCSEFIPTHPTPILARSTRLLYIGDRGFWLEYEGTGSWQSNHAETVNIRLLEEKPVPPRDVVWQGFPLLAIDFVTDYRTGIAYATDLNTSPGLGGTPIEEFLSPAQVYQSLSDWMAKPQ